MERTEIEELIAQAEAVKRKCRKPRPGGKVSNHAWQQLLDGKEYPHLRIGKL